MLGLGDYCPIYLILWMITQRGVEEPEKRSVFQAVTRYHSEEDADRHWLAKVRRNMHSNQSNYLMKRRTEKQEPNEETIHLQSETQKIKDVCLPLISYKHSNDCNNTLLKKGHPKTNMIWLHKNKKAKLNKIKLAELQQEKPKVYAYHTSLGSRIKNEDRVSICTMTVQQKTYQYFAIFDGHGGYLTSNYLSLHLHLILESFLNENKAPLESLRLSIALLEEKLRKNPRIGNKSGSCALICLTSGDSCWVANVGDSRLIGLSSSGVSQLTVDHKPQAESQKARIINNGGQIYRNIPQQNSDVHSRDIPYRVYPGKLSVSRAIGDVHIKRQNSKIVIAEPDLYTIDLKAYTHLVLFSDGIYQRLSNGDVGASFRAGGRLQESIKSVFDLAESRRSEDNRSIIAIKIQ